MKPILDSDFIDIVGDIEDKLVFRIDEKQSSIIINALINLYSKPIHSIVRELTANAIDSHRERDAKRLGIIPLEDGDDVNWFSEEENVQIVYLQSGVFIHKKPAIEFKDSGVGMSDERIREIFTTFGSSTKRGSNLEFGGYGLGAKSPFAYTDVFFIKSNYNGTSTLYMLSRQTHELTMRVISCEPTSDRNGVTVNIPLNDNDFEDSFKPAIIDQILYLKNVEFINVFKPSSYIPYIRPEYEDNLIIVYSNTIQEDTFEKQMFISIEGIRYNLDLIQVGIKKVDTLCGLKFDIGDLDLTPSKEYIRYTEKTKLTILSKIEELMDIGRILSYETDDTIDYKDTGVKIEAISKSTVASSWSSYLKVSKGKGGFYDVFEQLLNKDFEREVSIYLNEGRGRTFDLRYSQRLGMGQYYKVFKIIGSTFAETNRQFNTYNPLVVFSERHNRTNLEMLVYCLKTFSLNELQTMGIVLPDCLLSYMVDGSISPNVEMIHYAAVTEETPASLSFIKQFKESKRTLNLDNVKFPEEVKALFKKKSVVRTYVREDIYARDVYIFTGYSDTKIEFRENLITFEQLENWYADKNTFVVYGFQEDGELLKACKLFLPDNTQVLKIAKETEKFFTSFTYVHDLKYIKDNYIIRFNLVKYLRFIQAKFLQENLIDKDRFDECVRSLKNLSVIDTRIRKYADTLKIEDYPGHLKILFKFYLKSYSDILFTLFRNNTPLGEYKKFLKIIDYIKDIEFIEFFSDFINEGGYREVKEHVERRSKMVVEMLKLYNKKLNSKYE